MTRHEPPDTGDHQTRLVEAFAQQLAAFLEYDASGVRVRLANVLGFRYRWDHQRNTPVATFHCGRADCLIWNAAPAAAAAATADDTLQQWHIAVYVNGVPRATVHLLDMDTLLRLVDTYC